MKKAMAYRKLTATRRCDGVRLGSMADMGSSGPGHESSCEKRWIRTLRPRSAAPAIRVYSLRTLLEETSEHWTAEFLAY